MTVKQFKRCANRGYERFYKLAVRSGSNIAKLKYSAQLTGFLDGLRELGTVDDDIDYDDYDAILTYCRMLEDRFDKRFDI